MLLLFPDLILSPRSPVIDFGDMGSPFCLFILISIRNLPIEVYYQYCMQYAIDCHKTLISIELSENLAKKISKL